MTPEELEAIRARDAAAGALWFTGPASFTASAARDRRALLQILDRYLPAWRGIASCSSCEACRTVALMQLERVGAKP